MSVLSYPASRSAEDTRWIQTFTGRQFWPLDARPEEVDLLDIAAALSKQCRFAGHCISFYSVAEHSVLIYAVAKRRGEAPHALRAALMHDASEAYLSDILRPIKSELTNYHEIEDRLMRVIAQRFDFAWPLPPIVKQLDNAILANELNQNMRTPPQAWSQIEGEPLDIELQCWSPARAYIEFMLAADECGCKL